MKLLYYLIFLFTFTSGTSQNSVSSPFTLTDYEEMQKRFFENLKSKGDQAIKIKDDYYSTKKLDSLLLIKNKFKTEKLLAQGVKHAEISKYLETVKDDIVLPYAYYYEYAKGFRYTVNQNGLLTAEKGNMNVRFYSPRNHYQFYTEQVTDLERELVTTKVYNTYKIPLSERTSNSTFGFAMGKVFDYNDDGTIKKVSDYDTGWDFSYYDLKKSYRSKIEKYMKEHPQSLSGEDQFEIAKNLKYGKKVGGNTFDIQKQVYEGKHVWFVIINQRVFVFDGKTGEIIKLTRIFYEE